MGISFHDWICHAPLDETCFREGVLWALRFPRLRRLSLTCLGNKPEECPLEEDVPTVKGRVALESLEIRWFDRMFGTRNCHEREPSYGGLYKMCHNLSNTLHTLTLQFDRRNVFWLQLPLCELPQLESFTAQFVPAQSEPTPRWLSAGDAAAEWLGTPTVHEQIRAKRLREVNLRVLDHCALALFSPDSIVMALFATFTGEAFSMTLDTSLLDSTRFALHVEQHVEQQQQHSLLLQLQRIPAAIFPSIPPPVASVEQHRRRLVGKKRPRAPRL